jgi:hypothetical protein
VTDKTISYRHIPPGDPVLLIDGKDVDPELELTMTARGLALMLSRVQTGSLVEFQRGPLPAILGKVVAAVRNAGGTETVSLGYRRTVKRDERGQIVEVLEEPVVL